ncbi:MAG: hypothetical protein WCG21_04120 [Eubacteriales bacterium]
MQICPNCGNSYSETGKYCPCCGNATGSAAASNTADTTYLFCIKEENEPKDVSNGDSGAELPVPTVPDMSEDAAQKQPIWVTQSLNQPHNGPLDESFLEVPISEDLVSRENPPENHLKSSSMYNDSVDTDFFDEVADSASTLYSLMSPKTKRLMISIIIGTLLSLIPFIYVACSYNSGPTAGSKSQVTTSIILRN